MNFRRQPFQFNTIDPAKRQAELQKRFGLPKNNSDMYVDFLNPSFMGAGMKEPSLASGGSPRLQHRLPSFTGDASKTDSEQNNVDGGHKPRVRVVPIQVEGVDGDSRRHRTFSGPAGIVNGNNSIFRGGLRETFPHPDTTPVQEKIKQTSQPRVCNIPIQIEPREEKPKVQPKSKTPEVAKKLKTEQNSHTTKVETKQDPVPNIEKQVPVTTEPSIKKQYPVKPVPIRQIETVLGKLKDYGEQVEKFSGTSKDKQYRYLDEMLTRCMLELDDVDTLGKDEYRKARKEAVRQVQHFVDLLDTKVNERVEKIESGSSSVNDKVEVSEGGDIDCNIPASASENTLDTSEDIEIRETVSESKDIEENTTTDVDLVDETATNEQGVANETIEVSFQDGVESSTSVPEVDMESTTCNEPDCEMNNCEHKSGIVIEELDSGSNICASEDVSCVVTTSPERSVKDAIVEEDNSTVEIEEVVDSVGNNQDIDHSIGVCDGSATNSNKLSEQFNVEGETSETDTELPSFDLPPVEREKV